MPLPGNKPITQDIRSASIADTIDYVKRSSDGQTDSDSVDNDATADELATKKICGYVKAVGPAGETAVAGAHVELHRVLPMSEQIARLSSDVVTHCRKLLLDELPPLSLYDDVADNAPVIAYTELLQLLRMPGYEMLVAAARGNSDIFFSQLLRNNPAILRPLLCYYHPISLASDCSATAITDSAGFFHFPISREEAQARCGYRFSVCRSISPNLFITLYNPAPAGWYTHWNVFREDVITLRTRHPLALAASY